MNRFRYPLHPFFFSAYAALGVYATNANEIPADQILRPLLVLLGLTVCIFAVFYKWTNEANRAGYLTTLFLFWFVYFGHINFFASLFPDFRSIPGNRILAALIWGAILLILSSKKVWKLFTEPARITAFLNIVSIVILIIPVATTVFIIFQTARQKEAISDWKSQRPTIALDSDQAIPDIYYIILDGYGRDDVLQNLYQHDNSEFTQYLSDKGFFVAAEGTSNYMQTELSLASTLNMTYLDDLSKGMGNSQNRGPLNELIQNSLVRSALARKGYRFITVPSAVLFTQIRNADVLLSFSKSPLTEFEGLITIKTVFGAFIEDFDVGIPLPNYATHRAYIAHSLNSLKKIPSMPGPKIVFIHILAPHPPFVFDEKGSAIQPNRPYFIGDATGFQGSKDEYVTGYTGEITYLNNQLKEVIETILVESQMEPVIILHGDHGPGAYTSFTDPEKSCLVERFSIFLGVFLPGQDYSQFKKDMSLVNLFPTTFNSQFKTELSLQPNRHYYATWTQPYQHIDVTSKVDTCDSIDE